MAATISIKSSSSKSLRRFGFQPSRFISDNPVGCVASIPPQDKAAIAVDCKSEVEVEALPHVTIAAAINCQSAGAALLTSTPFHVRLATAIDCQSAPAMRAPVQVTEAIAVDCQPPVAVEIPVQVRLAVAIDCQSDAAIEAPFHV